MARPVARFEVPFEPPLVTWPVGDPAPRYYDWRETLPFLRVMLDNRAAIEAELAATATCVPRRLMCTPIRVLFVFVFIVFACL